MLEQDMILAIERIKMQPDFKLDLHQEHYLHDGVSIHRIPPIHEDFAKKWLQSFMRMDK
jgi:hypothetical protein